MRAVILAVLLTALLAVAFATKKSYNQYKLVKINVSTDAALADLKKILGPETDVWSNDGVLVKNFDNDVLLTPHLFETLTWYSQRQNGNAQEFGPATVAKFELIHNNIQELLDAEEAANLAAQDDDYFKKYHKYAEVIEYVKKTHEANKDITSVFKIGESWGKRDIVGIKLSVGNDDKPQFFFDGLVHAREWIGAAVVQYAFTKFIEKYKAGDAKVVAILKKFNIVFVPIVNPDGYEYTFTNDRLWRKNRRDNGKNIFGVDLNRNWPLGWGVGASTNPSSIVYQGPSRLSEPEAHSLNDYLTAHANNTKAGIDFHSYSQLILRPWSYSSATSDQEKRFSTLGAHMQKAIKDTHNLHYQNIKGIELYPAGGVLGDQFYGTYKYPGWTVELRDTGRYGFVLPPDQILPCSEENFAAIVALIEHIDDK